MEMSRDTNKCKCCAKLYQKGFLGAGYKYCSKICRESDWRMKNAEYCKERYKRLHKKTIRDCVICGRDIGSVGSRNNISKYCSTRCMFLGRKVRNGQKYCYVRIPITVQKLVKIEVKDIPLILKGVGKT